MSRGKVVFVGAGPGDPELITVRAKKYIESADVIIYAGSLVNPEVLKLARPDARMYDSARMTLEEIVDVMVRSAREGKLVVRVKSGDPCVYGALLEEVWALEDAGIPYEVVPGVTSATAAASVIPTSLTIPKVSQTIIITRASFRTQMQESLREYAKHVMRGATLVVYFSAQNVNKVVEELREGGLDESTPAIVVYKATWPDQRVIRGTLGDIADRVRGEGIRRTAIMIVGFAADPGRFKGLVRSSVYDPSHAHSFRPARA